MRVTNDLDETTTLHWHGMHLPAAMDGGRHQSIAPGTTWSPTWTVDQPAATLWCHPHLHGGHCRARLPGARLSWREAVVVVMAWFTGCKTATTESYPTPWSSWNS